MLTTGIKIFGITTKNIQEHFTERKCTMKTANITLSILLMTAAFSLSACGQKSEPISASIETPVPIEETATSETEQEIDSTPTQPTEEETVTELPETTEDNTPTETSTEPSNVISEVQLTKYVNVSSANLRTGAGQEYDKIGIVSYGTELEINGETTSIDGKIWYRIVYNDEPAFISSALLTDTKPEVKPPVQTTDPNTGAAMEDNSPAAQGQPILKEDGTKPKVGEVTGHLILDDGTVVEESYGGGDGERAPLW